MADDSNSDSRDSSPSVVLELGCWGVGAREHGPYVFSGWSQAERALVTTPQTHQQPEIEDSSTWNSFSFALKPTHWLRRLDAARPRACQTQLSGSCRKKGKERHSSGSSSAATEAAPAGCAVGRPAADEGPPTGHQWAVFEYQGPG